MHERCTAPAARRPSDVERGVRSRRNADPVTAVQKHVPESKRIRVVFEIEEIKTRAHFRVAEQPQENLLPGHAVAAVMRMNRNRDGSGGSDVTQSEFIVRNRFPVIRDMRMKFGKPDVSDMSVPVLRKFAVQTQQEIRTGKQLRPLFRIAFHPRVFVSFRTIEPVVMLRARGESVKRDIAAIKIFSMDDMRMKIPFEPVFRPQGFVVRLRLNLNFAACGKHILAATPEILRILIPKAGLDKRTERGSVQVKRADRRPVVGNPEERITVGESMNHAAPRLGLLTELQILRRSDDLRQKCIRATVEHRLERICSGGGDFERKIAAAIRLRKLSGCAGDPRPGKRPARKTDRPPVVNHFRIRLFTESLQLNPVVVNMADARCRLRAVADCLHGFVQNAFAQLKSPGMIMAREKGFHIRVFVQNIQNLRTVPHIGVAVVVQQGNMGDDDDIFMIFPRLFQFGAEPAARFGGKHSVPLAQFAPRMFDLVLFILRITLRPRRSEAADIESVQHDKFNSAGLESIEKIVKPEQTLQLLFGIFDKIMVADNIFDRVSGFCVLFQNRRHFAFRQTVAKIPETDNKIKILSIEFTNRFMKQDARLAENASCPRFAIGELNVADQSERYFRNSRFIHKWILPDK